MKQSNNVVLVYDRRKREEKEENLDKQEKIKKGNVASKEENKKYGAKKVFTSRRVSIIIFH